MVNMVNMTVRKVDAVLFDKDGTLFDFQATWGAWARDVIAILSQGDAGRAEAMAEAMGFDPARGRFSPGSEVIASTSRQTAECIARALPDWDIDALEDFLVQRSTAAPLTPPVALAPLLDDLLARGLRLGVMTNDRESAARAHLDQAGIAQRFHFIAGYDSGHGAKPAPAPLLAFAEATGVDPARVAMVGDSIHDLIAGRAAGMWTIAVLTGIATAEDLVPHADAVLEHIGHLPAWLDGQTGQTSQTGQTG